MPVLLGLGTKREHECPQMLTKSVQRWVAGNDRVRESVRDFLCVEYRHRRPKRRSDRHGDGQHLRIDHPDNRFRREPGSVGGEGHHRQHVHLDGIGSDDGGDVHVDEDRLTSGRAAVTEAGMGCRRLGRLMDCAAAIPAAKE